MPLTIMSCYKMHRYFKTISARCIWMHAWHVTGGVWMSLRKALSTLEKLWRIRQILVCVLSAAFRAAESKAFLTVSLELFARLNHNSDLAVTHWTGVLIDGRLFIWISVMIISVCCVLLRRMWMRSVMSVLQYFYIRRHIQNVFYWNIRP